LNLLVQNTRPSEQYNLIRSTLNYNKSSGRRKQTNVEPLQPAKKHYYWSGARPSLFSLFICTFSIWKIEWIYNSWIYKYDNYLGVSFSAGGDAYHLFLYLRILFLEVQHLRFVEWNFLFFIVFRLILYISLQPIVTIWILNTVSNNAPPY
jgi:hypothetical protein